MLVLGAEKTPAELFTLELAYNASQGGARGIAFGGNIVQSCNPPGFIEAARVVMNGKSSIEQALKTYQLAEK
jgi:DhnA family fructose-bisphosphate aldolase class Ia